ncbi:hypothetical protein QYE76_060196 [Lolium multiflorum]|uniref:Uncharacterized protein n=1 Tax=Lolium multiflorum TaxID=4521 RepID=A0AAD8W3K2_LOLMU|nr:hypothetical protein QYE76_060196 [Lolium multiflorum]
MTKLFDRTFAASAEDAAADAEVSERIGLLQRFVRPEHLDIPKVLHNEASWLVSRRALFSLALAADDAMDAADDANREMELQLATIETAI